MIATFSSAERGSRTHICLSAAFSHAAIDRGVWKISFVNPVSGKLFRLLR